MSRGTKDLLRGAAPHGGHRGYPPQAPTPPPDRRTSDAAGRGATLMDQLQTKLEAQRRELDDRTDNVNAIQRNFARLSEMYAADREKVERLEQDNTPLQAELDALRAEGKVARAVREEYAALQAKHAAAVSAHDAALNQMTLDLAAARKEGEAAKRDARMAEGTVAQLQAAAKGVQEAEVKAKADAAAMRQTVAGSLAALAMLCVECRVPAANISGWASVIDDLRGMPPDAAAADQLSKAREVLASGASRQGTFGFIAEEFVRRAGVAEADVARLQQEAETEAARTKGVVSQLEGRLEAKTLECQTLQAKLREAARMYEEERSVSKHGKAEAVATAVGQKDVLLTAAKEEIESLRVQLQRMTSDRDAEAVQRAACEAEVAELTAALQRARVDLDVARTAAVDAASAHAVDAARLQELAKAQGERAADSQHRIRTLEAKFAAAEETAARLRAELDAATRANHSAASASTGQVADLQRRLKDMEHEASAQRSAWVLERDEAQRALEESEGMRVDSLREVDRLRAELDTAARELDAAMAKCGRLEAINRETVQRESAKAGDITSLLEAKAKWLDSEAELLREATKLRDANAYSSKELETARARLLAAEQRVEALSDEVLRHSSRADKAAREADDSKRFADDARRRASVSDDAKAGAIREAARLKGEADSVTIARSRLRARMEEVEQWSADVRALQQQSVVAAMKLLTAEEACESSYSCQSCLDLMKDPVILAPCGHAFCQQCHQQEQKRSSSSKPRCAECDTAVTAVVPSRHLDLLAGKFSFRKTALKELAMLLESTLQRAPPDLLGDMDFTAP